MKNSNKIKKDVLALYSILYPMDETERQILARLFSKDVLKLLRYTPSEVEIALSLENDSCTISSSTTGIEQSIKDKEDVRIYVFTHFGEISKHMMSEEKIAENLSSISLNDLKYMYSLLIDVPLNGKITKKSVLYKIFEFFDAEKRIDDFTKNL